jgi:hypothetical protein
MSTVVPLAHFCVHYAAWCDQTTGHPSPSYFPGCWYYKTKNYYYSPNYTCMELLLCERTQILIPFSNLEIHWALWPCGLRCGSSATCWLGLWVHILPETWMSLLCECCVLSVRGFCSGLLPHFRGVLSSVCTCMREIGVWKTLHLQYAVRKGQIIKETKRNFVTKNEF